MPATTPSQTGPVPLGQPVPSHGEPQGTGINDHHLSRTEAHTARTAFAKPKERTMLTVHATLEPDGRVQLPASLARATPVPVLVTILEPAPSALDASGTPAATGATPAHGSVEATLALLRSPEFLALPKADAAEVEQRILDLRNDWGGQ